MNQRVSFISLFIISVFILSCVFMQFAPACEWVDTKKGMTISESSGHLEMFQRQLADGQVGGLGLYACFESKQLPTRFFDRMLQGFGQSVNLTIVFLIRGVLYQKGKGRLFVCFITFLHQKAHFLYELCIRKKKDGKKWSLVA